MTPQAQPETAPGHEAKGGPVQHSIRIEVDGTRLKYIGGKGEDATRITVKPDHIIVWQCDDGNHAVLFKSRTPFAEVAYHGHRGSPTEEAKVIGVNGEYHYAVTVVNEDGQPITDDPVIIVNDGD